MKILVTTFCLLFSISQAWGQMAYELPGFSLKKKSPSLGEYCETNFLSEEVDQTVSHLKGITGAHCYDSESSPATRLNLNNTKMNVDLRRCACLGFIKNDSKKQEGKNELLEGYKEEAALEFAKKSFENKNENSKENFKKNLSETWDEIEGKRNAAALSASLYFSQQDLAAYFSNDKKDGENVLIEAVGKLAGTSVGKSVMKTGVLSFLKASPEAREKNELDKIASEIMKSKDVEKVLKDEIPDSQNNCISPKEFISFNQLPPEDILPKDMSKFNENEWKFNALIEEYKENKDEKIKKKIHFLNKNPMIRLVLDQGDSVKKQELMTLLTNYGQVTDTCKDVCNLASRADSIIENDKNFRNGLTKFFSDKDNRDFLRELSEKEWKKEVKDLETKVQISSFADNAFATSREELLDGFYKDHGKKSIELCELKYLNLISVNNCHSNYAHYCQYIEKNAGYRAAFIPDKNRDANLVKEMTEERSFDFYGDGGKGKGRYAELNKRVCDFQVEKNGKKISFNQFRKNCSDSVNICRKKFADMYKDELLFSVEGEEFVRMAYSFEVPFEKMDKKEAERVALGGVSKKEKDEMSEKFETFRRRNGYSDSSGVYAGRDKEVKTVTAGGTPLPNLQQAPVNAPQYFIPTVANSASSASESADRTIDSYSKSEQRSLLESWQKELEALKNTPVTGAEKQSAKLASEKALEERIAMLERLIIQQKELSDKQYALLNDSLKSKEKELENRISELDEEKKVRTASATKKTGAEFEEGPGFRAPASVRAPQYQSGIGSGETAGARLGSGSVGDVQSSSQAMKEAANREALAREEAKLIKLRQEAGGAIVLESSKSNSANAIAVAITDEFYKQAKGNLGAINLKQIEKNIPKDQIDLLEKQGVITLILQNGTNPPLEVKVTRKNGRLVQLDNSPAVVRRVSLQSLQNSFRN